MIWTDETINRFAEDGEGEIAQVVKCITKRVCLSVRAFRSVYSIPDDVVSIRRITWKGKKLEPKMFSGYLQYPVINAANEIGAFDAVAFDDGFFVEGVAEYTQPTGTPYLYFYSGFGENYIKLFPTPVETVAADNTDLFGSSIANAVIVEYYCLPDVTGTSYRIPTYVARRAIRNYVLSRCFQMEGPGQDLLAAKRYDAKFKADIEDFRVILSGVFVAKTNTRTPLAGVSPTRISRPRLPSNFGVPCE